MMREFKSTDPLDPEKVETFYIELKNIVMIKPGFFNEKGSTIWIYANQYPVHVDMAPDYLYRIISLEN